MSMMSMSTFNQNLYPKKIKIITMQKNQSLSIRARKESIKFALNGVTVFFRNEPNAILHLIGTGLVILLGILLDVSRFEMIALVFAIGFVWVAELFNTCIEKSMDLIS